jgi:hypothetical protein
VVIANVEGLMCGIDWRKDREAASEAAYEAVLPIPRLARQGCLFILVHTLEGPKPEPLPARSVLMSLIDDTPLADGNVGNLVLWSEFDGTYRLEGETLAGPPGRLLPSAEPLHAPVLSSLSRSPHRRGGISTRSPANQPGFLIPLVSLDSPKRVRNLRVNPPPSITVEGALRGIGIHLNLPLSSSSCRSCRRFGPLRRETEILHCRRDGSEALTGHAGHFGHFAKSLLHTPAREEEPSKMPF